MSLESVYRLNIGECEGAKFVYITFRNDGASAFLASSFTGIHPNKVVLGEIIKID